MALITKDSEDKKANEEIRNKGKFWRYLLHFNVVNHTMALLYLTLNITN